MSALSLALAVVSHSPAAARPNAVELASAKQAEMRGAELYAYDQAAWHATDRFLVDVKQAGERASAIERSGRGYVIEPGASGMLLVTFVGEREGRRIALGRYVVSGSTVMRGGLVSAEESDALSPLALRMFAARDRAMERGFVEKLGLCSSSPPNFIVLPPRGDDIIPVYMLTSTTTAAFPLGGHYLFEVAADGSIRHERAFAKSCLAFDPLAVAMRKSQSPVGMVVSHLLDGHPTEIHSFVSRNVPSPLYVVTTSNQAIWAVENGAIRYIRDAGVATMPASLPKRLN